VSRDAYDPKELELSLKRRHDSEELVQEKERNLYQFDLASSIERS